MFFKTKQFQLCFAVALGIIVILLPRPEGTKFKITGDEGRLLLQDVSQQFALVPAEKEKAKEYIVEAINPKSPESTAQFLQDKAAQLKIEGVEVDYVNGLSPKAKRFLVVLVVLIFLFVVEPIPLEITAICIGVFLVVMGVSNVKEAWAPYMHPVVVFIMCCLIFAISLDKAGITKRLGYFIVKRAGTSVTKFTFIIAISLGISSSFMHDAAACAIGIITMLPLMRAAGIEPHTKTAKFMMLSLPFACSCGGMGSLIGGGRCMVAAAFLKEFTGLEISFFNWIKYAMPAAIICVPVAVTIVYLVFRPNPKYKLPVFDEEIGLWSALEKKTLIIIGLTFALWFTKGFHGIHGYSGAATYFANLFFPLVQGGGWLLLFAGVAVFGALVTNAMANVAAAALILPIVIPMARLEGVDPTVIALCLGMGTSFAMLLVIGCPPNAIAYSYRYFKAADLTKVGLVATPILLVILILVASTWWKVLGLV